MNVDEERAERVSDVAWLETDLEMDPPEGNRRTRSWCALQAVRRVRELEAELEALRADAVAAVEELGSEALEQMDRAHKAETRIAELWDPVAQQYFHVCTDHPYPAPNERLRASDALAEDIRIVRQLLVDYVPQVSYSPAGTMIEAKTTIAGDALDRFDRICRLAEQTQAVQDAHV